MVSLDKGVNTRTLWEGLIRPSPVKVEDPAAAAAEAVGRGQADSVALENDAPLGLPAGGTSIDLTNWGGF